jgi:hypothetical protein
VCVIHQHVDYGLLEQLRGPGTAFEALDDGRPVEL